MTIPATSETETEATTQTPEWPRYQTNFKSEFKRHWSGNPMGTWLASKYTNEEHLHLVLVGKYQDVYQEVLKRWPVRSLDQGWDLKPVQLITVQ